MSLIWIALNNIKGLGPKRIYKLHKLFPKITIETLTDPKNLTLLKEIITSDEIIEKIVDRIELREKLDFAKEHVERHHKKNIEVITIGSENYPELLRLIEDPPVVLYAKGNTQLLQEEKSIAVIGTRDATEMGIRSAMRISSMFANLGYVIVSGLALGIDTAGHEGALRVNGKTIAVLAGSLDKVYPKSNEPLADRIIEKEGLLISEYPLGSATFKQSFVKRDRIQSGLSLGVCPVQTDVKGGTQHTISFARKQNRLLFCPTPTDGDIKQNRGIFELLKDSDVEELRATSDYENLDNLLIKTRRALLSSMDIDDNSHMIKQKSKELNQITFEMINKVDELCSYAKKSNLDKESLITLIREQWDG